MKKVGVHIIVILLLITSGLRFLTTVDGFAFDCSIFAILLGVPTFIAIDVFYIISCIVRKKNVQITFSIGDLITIVFSIAIWGYIVYSHSASLHIKTMVNYIESGLVAISSCILYAIRCFYAYRGDLKKFNLWKKLSLVVIPVVAILFAYFFPPLSE